MTSKKKKPAKKAVIKNKAAPKKSSVKKKSPAGKTAPRKKAAPDKKTTLKKTAVKKKATAKKTVTKRKNNTPVKKTATATKKTTTRKKPVKKTSSLAAANPATNSMILTMPVSTPILMEEAEKETVEQSPAKPIPAEENKDKRRLTRRDYDPHRIRLNSVKKGGPKPSGKKPLW